MFNYVQKEYLKSEVWFNISLSLYDTSQKDKYNVYNFSEKNLHKWLGVLLVRRREHTLGMWHLNQALDILDYDDETVSMAIIREHCSAGFRRPTHLHCRYNNFMTPFLRIAPLKMEELSLDPLILLYHKAIYNSEIESLLNRSLNLTPPLAHDEQLSPLRDVDQTIKERVVDMSGLNMDHSEVLHLNNDDIGVGFHLEEDELLETVNKHIYSI